jgi:hypothetical protein
MQLTESEKKIVERTRKISASWPKGRWIILPILIVVVALAITYLCSASELAGNVLSGFVAYLCIKQVYRVCKQWRGIPQNELLLKLADENEKLSN